MMKKKNMAMAMAAVTVASTVAPAFAATAENTTQENITLKEYGSLESKIKDMLTKKYGKDLMGSTINEGDKVYDVTVTTTGDTLSSVGLVNGKIENDAQLKAVSDIINKSEKGTVFNFVINDKGHAVKSDGTITNKGVNTYTIQDIVNENSIDTLDNLPSSYTVEQKFNDKELTRTLTFKKGDVIEYTMTLKAGDKKRNFADAKTSGVQGSEKLIGFGYLEEELAEKTQNISVANAEEEKLTVSKEDAKTIAETLNKKYVFAKGAIADAKSRIALVDGKYQTVLYAENIKLDVVTKSVKAATPDKTLAQIVLTGNTKEDVEAVLDALVGNAEFTQIAGEHRIDTAIQLSEKTYNKDGKTAANAAVLVGQYAIVDGLSAAPLAAKADAPLLLTETNSLTKEVKAELVRALGLKNTVNDNKNKTIYLVGGEAVISKNVELELLQMGVKVERLSGDDREATSREVAKKVSTSGNAFVVDGYKGLADAMSISSVASKKGAEAPIVVVNGATELNKDAKDFLRGYSAATVIGGDAVVTEKSLNSIADATGTAARIAGSDRQETNAKIIEKYYANEAEKGLVFVAKDGYTNENELVDALAAAPIAGDAKAPIVLATSSMTTDQAIAVTKIKDTDPQPNNRLVQVGGGIANSVIETAKKFLGL